MPCGWEGNRRSGVALAMRHRHPPTDSRPRRGRWAPAYALLVEYGKLYLFCIAEIALFQTKWTFFQKSLLMTVAVYKLQDRILFRCRKKNSVACLCYNSARTQRESDHKPVYAVFEVIIKPGTDTYVYPCQGGCVFIGVWLFVCLSVCF